MVDVHQSGDYKIILGDSLKDDNDSATSHIGIKYNWIPKSGFEGSSGKLKASRDDLSLTYEHDQSQYEYSGWLSEQTDRRPQLALLYDRDKAAFVLEKIQTSVEVNIGSGTNMTSDQIKRHAQLRRPQTVQGHERSQAPAEDLRDGSDGESPDPSNPFDYRHFVDEAKDATEKASHHATGGRTPLTGARTPMSGLSSPLIASGHHPFQSTTPQFGPIEIVDSTNKEMNEYPDRRRQKGAKATKTRPRTAPRKPQSSAPAKARTSSQPKQQALSKERVVDSDSDDDASADMSDHPSPVPAPPPKKSTKSHNRNISTASVPSLVNDDGGLEIDSGPPTQSSRKKAYKIDPDAFRSQTATPHLGQSSNSSRFQTSQRPISRDSNADIDMLDADADEEENEAMKYLQDDDDDGDFDGERDGDVDELVLDDGPTKSPSPPPEPIKAPKPTKRRQSSTNKRFKPARSPSPPRQEQQDSMEDDDGALVDELEKAFLREQEELERRMQEDNDDDDGGAFNGRQDDDESDISEEE